MKIYGIPHQADGSGFYRFWLPFEHLARFTSHHVALPNPGEAVPMPPDEVVAECDLVVGQRWMFDKGVDTCTRWRELTTVVYECDDDLFHPDRSSGLAHLFDPHTQETIRQCVSLCQLVTASTEPLAEQLREYNDNVVVCPNHIDANMLYIDRTHADALTVGWAGGMSHLNDWILAAPAIGAVLEAHPGWEMHFMGIDYAPLMQNAPSRYTPWNPHTWSYWRSIDFDIGVAPLADTTFNHSKSHIRALEYMALGIPVIATDCPAYRGLVVDGVTGYLVSSEDEWRDRLTELIEDEQLREDMGAKGREVASGLVIQRGWQYWRDAYEGVT